MINNHIDRILGDVKYLIALIVLGPTWEWELDLKPVVYSLETQQIGSAVLFSQGTARNLKESWKLDFCWAECRII